MLTLSSVIYTMPNKIDGTFRFLTFPFNKPIQFFGYDFRNEPRLITITFKKSVEHRVGFDEFENISYSAKFDIPFVHLTEKDAVCRFINPIVLEFSSCHRLPKEEFLKLFPNFSFEGDDKFRIDLYTIYDEGNPPEMIFVGYHKKDENENYVLDRYGIPHKIENVFSDPSSFSINGIQQYGSCYIPKEKISEIFKDGKDFGDRYSYVIDEVLPNLIKNPLPGFPPSSYIPVTYLCEKPDSFYFYHKKVNYGIYMVSKEK